MITCQNYTLFVFIVCGSTRKQETNAHWTLSLLVILIVCLFYPLPSFSCCCCPACILSFSVPGFIVSTPGTVPSPHAARKLHVNTITFEIVITNWCGDHLEVWTFVQAQVQNGPYGISLILLLAVVAIHLHSLHLQPSFKILQIWVRSIYRYICLCPSIYHM